ncbi:hypothetical protein BH23VER1_BH23VER1_04520 [soil metagenome]
MARSLTGAPPKINRAAGGRKQTRMITLFQNVPVFATLALAMFVGFAPSIDAKGLLDGLPSPMNPQVEQIRVMEARTWLELGAPADDPEWGSARGRSWSAKMPAAEDLGGAFLFGEGVHGWWDKDSGRYMDDLWFYDLNAHRWICLHPGTKVPGDGLAMTDDGFEAGPDGHPTPVASMAHGYGQLTYDPERQRFLAMPCPGDYWKDALSARAVAPDRPNESHASPWIYDVAAGHWTRIRTAQQRPPSSFGDTLVYLPSRDKIWFRHNAPGQRQVALYDPGTNDWQPVDVSGPPPPFGIDANDCYDTKRDRIYLGGGQYPIAPGNALWVYDVATATWSDPQPSGSPGAAGTSYGTNEALMHYDVASDLVVLIRHRGPDESKGVHGYDPAANTWTTVDTELPDFGGRQAVSGFYHTALNVHVIFAAGDSRDDGVVWLYRHENP